MHKEAEVQRTLLFVGETNVGLYFEPKNQQGYSTTLIEHIFGIKHCMLLGI